MPRPKARPAIDAAAASAFRSLCFGRTIKGWRSTLVLFAGHIAAGISDEDAGEQSRNRIHDAGGHRRGVRRLSRVSENPRPQAANSASYRFRGFRQWAAQGRQRELRRYSDWTDQVAEAGQS